MTNAPSSAASAQYNANNVFAKILDGSLPAIEVYQDDKAIAIMDAFPQSNGHVLVIPRAPSCDIFDADPMVLAHVIQIVQKIAKAAKQAFKADGVSIKQFNGAAAGQTVFHLHFHIIPRYEGVEMKAHAVTSADREMLAQQAEAIRAAI